ncbi:MAG TPA: HU family DNA-binding protein [Actinomycetota bacterium]|nr:HU family DNA-binding protein [Actinomycetota bacterium]
MNRSELVSAIAERTGLDSKSVDSALRGFYEVVANVAATGQDKITIPGFLSFEQAQRSARTGRNPQTGEEMQIPATKTVKVSVGSKLKNIAAGKDSAP